MTPEGHSTEDRQSTLYVTANNERQPPTVSSSKKEKKGRKRAVHTSLLENTVDTLLLLVKVTAFITSVVTPYKIPWYLEGRG